MSYIIGGTVSTAQWCLVLICIVNTLNGLFHIYVVCNCTGCKTPAPDASEAITNEFAIPELIGIALSFAAFGVAISEICDNDSFLC